MNNKRYIMIGAPVITKEIFRNVLRPLNNYTFIPNGGFWSSEYIGPESISPWYKYLMYAKELARKKNINNSTIFTLKDNAKILTIDSSKQIIELSKQYPSYHHILGFHFSERSPRTTTLDFEKISQDYDGIYVNLKKLNNSDSHSFNEWDVNTLLLFNLDCIKEYQKAPIIYNIDDEYDYPYIEESKLETPQKIETESYEHQILSNLSETIYLEAISKYNTYNFEDYHEYFTTILKTSSNVIGILLKDEYNKIQKIQRYLQSKGIKVTKEKIISNIVLNYITKYLIQDIERIKSLPEAKIKTLTWYNK